MPTHTTHTQDAGGLELYNRKGQWVAVKPVPQTLVINVGDMMQRWTNDRYKSTLHRVINPSTGKHRYYWSTLLYSRSLVTHTTT
jgi:isopenicillin N synthase-like dioxygenase